MSCTGAGLVAPWVGRVRELLLGEPGAPVTQRSLGRWLPGASPAAPGLLWSRPAAHRIPSVPVSRSQPAYACASLATTKVPTCCCRRFQEWLYRHAAKMYMLTLLAGLPAAASKGWRSCSTRTCACGWPLIAEESATAPAQCTTSCHRPAVHKR